MVPASVGQPHEGQSLSDSLNSRMISERLELFDLTMAAPNTAAMPPTITPKSFAFMTRSPHFLQMTCGHLRTSSTVFDRSTHAGLNDEMDEMSLHVSTHVLPAGSFTLSGQPSAENVLHARAHGLESDSASTLRSDSKGSAEPASPPSAQKMVTVRGGGGSQQHTNNAEAATGKETQSFTVSTSSPW